MTFDDVPISPEMQHAFARLSGDVNPQHVDAVAARRLMLGGRVVHGIHSLLRALETAVASQPSCRRLAALRVSFDAPAFVGDRLRVETEGVFPAIRFAVRRDTQRVLRGRFDFAADPDALGSAAPAPPEAPCREWDPDNVAHRSGEIAVGVDAALLASLFPALAAAFDPAQVALLLGTSRLVGMECPGRRSIYAGLRLTFATSAAAPPRLTYRIAAWNPAYRMLQLDIANGDSHGVVECFVPPGPVQQLATSAVRQLVAPAEFADRHALVVGGSRGLGEVVAKIIIAGGGRVAVTFAAGRDDAARVVADMVAAGGNAVALPFDVRAPRNVAGDGGPFTHLYYFASPRIRPNAETRLDCDLLRDLLDHYALGLVRTVEAARDRLAPGAVICVPSTIFIDRPDPNFREYAAAKEAAEAVARRLGGGLLVQCPRLPRLRTDQTNALQDVGAGDALPAMLDLVRSGPPRA